MTQRPDSPELQRAIEMLREIYWREYGRGWRAAIAGIKAGLEQQTMFIGGEITRAYETGWRPDGFGGAPLKRVDSGDDETKDKS